MGDQPQIRCCVNQQICDRDCQSHNFFLVSARVLILYSIFYDSGKNHVFRLRSWVCVVRSVYRYFGHAHCRGTHFLFNVGHLSFISGVRMNHILSCLFGILLTNVLATLCWMNRDNCLLQYWKSIRGTAAP